MHPTIFARFDEICRMAGAGGRVLELGATPTPDTLLCLPALAGAGLRIGVNLDGPHRYRDFPILKADANDLALFRDGIFDTILCNSMLEHDPFFWRTLAEIKRLARPGALVVIGVPGFAEPPATRLRRWLGMLAHAPLGRSLRRMAETELAATPTLNVHHHAGDFYRFTAQAMREVFFAGYGDVGVETLMQPPRIIGWGRRR